MDDQQNTTRFDLPGALVLSLDFELAWGIRDHGSSDPRTMDRVRGARAVIPQMLALFEQFGVAATWATVGFLFAKDRTERLRLVPSLRPSYDDPTLSPYAEETGQNEEEDPLHFGATLIERVRRTPRQEIGTHTFSHYYCGEKGQNRDTFRADLEAARKVAVDRGIELRSIVFPRNQHNPGYDDILVELGLIAFRGNPPSYAWSFSDARESRRMSKRAYRLLDAYVGLTGPGTVSWSEILQANRLANVRASYPLRPCQLGRPGLDKLQLRRIKKSLVHAARGHEIFHLWWHPHNFGSDGPRNLELLQWILEEFDRCREAEGMASLTMAEVAGMAREGSGRDPRSKATASAGS